MNWERLKANWTQARGRVRMQWGKLTDDQLDVIEGRRELLVGRLQETYGVSAEDAERQVTDWENAEFGDEGEVESTAAPGPPAQRGA
jgi:uncharacterized protein YjbJ (UPF0337 family)